MWCVILEQQSQKQFNKLGVNIQNRIAKFIGGKLIPSGDPRALGKTLSGKSFGNYVRFRVGDYRLICDIQDQEITVLVLRIGHRKRCAMGEVIGYARVSSQGQSLQIQIDKLTAYGCDKIY